MTNPSVIIVGAGLAGLSAAKHLQQRGCAITLLEARNRIGGRVWTIREPFGAMHGEAGGELIDADQSAIRGLARELGLSEQRILRSGFAHYRLGPDAVRRIYAAKSGWRATETALLPLIEAFKSNEQEWDGPIASAIARRSVSDWLDDTDAAPEVRATATTMRNFFVGDPENLSLIVYVDQFASAGDPARNALFRIRGGNDRLVQCLAQKFGRSVRMEHVVRKIIQTESGIEVVVESGGQTAEIHGTCALATVPAPLVAEISFIPELPAVQHDALARLRYGPATKTLLQFRRPSWRRDGKPRACATDLEIGAVWDASEGQRNRKGMLALLAGGSASAATQRLLRSGDIDELVPQLGFFGVTREPPIAFRSVSWENENWSRGAYAVFDAGFPPEARPLLKKPFGRVFFAGEHTSAKWQGYMNGAVESGRRAAEEITVSFLR